MKQATFISVALAVFALQPVASALPLILATGVVPGNCSVSVTLNSLTASSYSGTLTYTFVPDGGGANVSFTPAQAAAVFPVFPVPGGTYTLWITTGPFSGATPTPGLSSSPGYLVTPAPCPLSNTGVANACKALSYGSSDPHWQLAAPFPTAPSGRLPLPPDASNGVPLVFGPAYAQSPDPAWLNSNSVSNWIGPTPATINQLGGEYVYQTTFSTSASAISGLYSSDNELVGVYLDIHDGNGLKPLTSFPLNGPADFGKWTAFTIGSLGSLNTLDFVVRNRGGGGIDSDGTVTGLRVQFTGGNPCTNVLSHVVAGGGWYTGIYLSNFTENPVAVPVGFFTNDGTPWTPPSLSGPSKTVSIPPHGTALVELPNSGDLVQGSASLPLPIGVSGYGVFRQSVAGIADQEAVVPLAQVGPTSVSLVWDDTKYTTAVAIANPSASQNGIIVSVVDEAGQYVGSNALGLPANGKMAIVLRQLNGLAGMAGHKGIATFTSQSGGPITVLGIRFNGSAFTSIPVQ